MQTHLKMLHKLLYYTLTCQVNHWNVSGDFKELSWRHKSKEHGNILVMVQLKHAPGKRLPVLLPRFTHPTTAHWL